MKRTKGLIKNLVKVDKDFELALNNLTDVVALNSSAILALGSVDSSGTLTKLSELLNQSSNPLNNYSINIFKSRQLLNQIIDLEQRWETVERDRELLVSQVIKASSKKSNYNSKLLESQRELRACENHLSNIEADLLSKRQSLIHKSVELRFQSLTEIGEAYLKLAYEGLDLIQVLPTSTNLLESNSLDSLSPSQSASQVADDGPEISGPINVVKNPNLKRVANETTSTKPRSISERALNASQPRDVPNTSMFTEQFSDSSVQSPPLPRNQYYYQQPLPQLPPQKPKSSFTNTLKSLFTRRSKQKDQAPQMIPTESQTKNFFNITWKSNSQSRSSSKQDIKPQSNIQSSGWQTRTNKNLKSLSRDNSSDEEQGGVIAVKNVNASTAIANQLSRQSSVASQQSKVKSSPIARSNSASLQNRRKSLPERPSSAASLPINSQQAQIRSNSGVKRKNANRTSSPPSLPSETYNKGENLINRNSNRVNRPNSTSMRNRKAVIHPNLMSIVETEAPKQYPSKSKGKGKEREDDVIQTKTSCQPARKGSNRSSLAGSNVDNQKTVSWAIPQSHEKLANTKKSNNINGRMQTNNQTPSQTYSKKLIHNQNVNNNNWQSRSNNIINDDSDSDNDQLNDDYSKARAALSKSPSL